MTRKPLLLLTAIVLLLVGALLGVGGKLYHAVIKEMMK